MHVSDPVFDPVLSFNMRVLFLHSNTIWAKLISAVSVSVYFLQSVPVILTHALIWVSDR